MFAIICARNYYFKCLFYEHLELSVKMRCFSAYILCKKKKNSNDICLLNETIRIDNNTIYKNIIKISEYYKNNNTLFRQSYNIIIYYFSSIE